MVVVIIQVVNIKVDITKTVRNFYLEVVIAVIQKKSMIVNDYTKEVKS